VRRLVLQEPFEHGERLAAGLQGAFEVAGTRLEAHELAARARVGAGVLEAGAQPGDRLLELAVVLEDDRQIEVGVGRFRRAFDRLLEVWSGVLRPPRLVECETEVVVGQVVVGVDLEDLLVGGDGLLETA
jgi:hypothetical protein